MYEWVGQMTDNRRELKRALQPSGVDGCGDVVGQILSRRGMLSVSRCYRLQSRWLVVVLDCNESSVVWQQLTTEPDDVVKLTVRGDLFRGKAPATLLKRARTVDKTCQFLGVGIRPVGATKIYKFSTFEGHIEL